MYSIRRRLVLTLAIGFTLVIALAGVFLDRSLSRQVHDEFDDTLSARARAITALIEAESDGTIEFDYPDGLMPEFERERRPDHYQIFLRGGRSLARSKCLTEDLPRADEIEGAALHDTTMPDGRAGRMLQTTYVPQADDAEDDDDEPVLAVPAITVIVARGIEPREATIAQMRWTILGFGALAVGLAALLAWFALARGLRPLDAIGAQVRELDAERLDARIELDPRPRELAPVVDQLNAMIARLRESFERERRFNANVAHELRTPIAELRSLADVGGKWPDDTATVQAFFGDVGAIAARMEATIADLLLLARCEAGVERMTPAPTDVHAAVEQTWRSVAGERAPEFHNELPRPWMVETDPGKLGIVLQNLLGNARAYATPGAAVTCRLVGARMEISNHAAPLAPEDLRRLTQPFWRADEARSSLEHVGLGLSVVAAVADLLGMRVDFAQDAAGRFTVGLEGWRPEEPAPLEAVAS